MLDFIVENIWWFIIIGVAIILVAIGYIVDKFVINKNLPIGLEVKANLWGGWNFIVYILNKGVSGDY